MAVTHYELEFIEPISIQGKAFTRARAIRQSNISPDGLSYQAPAIPEAIPIRVKAARAIQDYIGLGNYYLARSGL